MAVDVGRKVLVPVLMTEKLLDRVDEIAKRRAPPDTRPNRSDVIRSFVRAGVEALEALELAEREAR